MIKTAKNDNVQNDQPELGVVRKELNSYIVCLKLIIVSY